MLSHPLGKFYTSRAEINIAIAKMTFATSILTSTDISSLYFMGCSS